MSKKYTLILFKLLCQILGEDLLNIRHEIIENITYLIEHLNTFTLLIDNIWWHIWNYANPILDASWYEKNLGLWRILITNKNGHHNTKFKKDLICDII
jgi:hypothetical protein